MNSFNTSVFGRFYCCIQGFGFGGGGRGIPLSGLSPPRKFGKILSRPRKFSDFRGPPPLSPNLLWKSNNEIKNFTFLKEYWKILPVTERSDKNGIETFWLIPSCHRTPVENPGIIVISKTFFIFRPIALQKWLKTKFLVLIEPWPSLLPGRKKVKPKLSKVKQSRTIVCILNPTKIGLGIDLLLFPLL